MGFPISLPLVSIDINKLILSDVQPTPTQGYEVVLVKDLTWTKLWIEFKISTA